jgi:hypothetical protein
VKAYHVRPGGITSPEKKAAKITAVVVVQNDPLRVNNFEINGGKTSIAVNP